MGRRTELLTEEPPTIREQLEALRQEVSDLRGRVEDLEDDLDSKEGVIARLEGLEGNFEKAQLYLERIVVLALETVRFFLEETRSGEVEIAEFRRYTTRLRARILSLVRLIKFRRSTTGRTGQRTLRRKRK